MSYNRGNNNGYNRNYNGNGNGNRGNNRSQGNDHGKYLNPSSTKKVIHYNGDTDPTTGKDKTLRVSFSENETEEISFSLTPEKVQDFINRLQAASEAEGGTGGAYLSFYCKRSRNNRTGEEFDGINILINRQNPPDERYQRGNFRGRGGGGRRDYPQTNHTSSNYGGSRGSSNATNGASRPTNAHATNGSNYDTGRAGAVPARDNQTYPPETRGPDTYVNNNSYTEPEF